MKFIRLVLQLILAVPFYYLSMLATNFTLSVSVLIFDTIKEKGLKETLTTLQATNFDYVKWFEPMTEFSYAYVLIGLIVGYYVIIKPIANFYNLIYTEKRSSYKHKKDDKNIGKAKKSNRNYKDKSEEKSSVSENPKSASDILRENTAKMIGEPTNKKSNESVKDEKDNTTSFYNYSNDDLDETDEDFFLNNLESVSSDLPIPQYTTNLEADNIKKDTEESTFDLSSIKELQAELGLNVDEEDEISNPVEKEVNKLAVTKELERIEREKLIADIKKKQQELE